jgi:hypothetical protein
MKRQGLLLRIAAASICFAAIAGISILPAAAHPGGLNAEGCHNNRKTGEYHCHRGKANAPLKFKGAAKKDACGVQAGKCSGCGCKGGPGYRNLKTGNCVGFKNLNAECGIPPTLRCTFENARGTGANRVCVLGH